MLGAQGGQEMDSDGLPRGRTHGELGWRQAAFFVWPEGFSTAKIPPVGLHPKAAPSEV